MSQNDFAIADQTFPATLADLNAAFQALASLSSDATAPATTYPYQLWADTAADLLKVRNGANNAWLTLAKFDTTNNRWEPRADILQALTTAGVTIRNAAGTTIATFSNAGTMSGVSITVGAGKVLDISLGTLTLADNQIDGVKVKAATTTTRGTVEQATTAEAETATPGKFPDAAGVAAAIAALAPAVTRYESAEITLVVQTSHAVTHGLAAQPRKVGAYLVCKTADRGYAVGDRLYVHFGGTFSDTFQMTLGADATQAWFRIRGGIYVNDKAAAVSGGIVLSSWKVVIWAEL